MNSSASSTKTWSLLRYAVEIHPHSTSSSSIERAQLPQRQVIDCSEGLLNFVYTPTQQLLVIRDEIDKLESIDLLATDSSSILATYTGDSLLISYPIPHDHSQRKFLMKFASTTTQNACQQCQDCVAYLSRFLTITHFDSTSSETNNHSIVSLSDMIQSLMKDNSSKLSNYYNQDLSTFDCNENSQLFQKYFSDETFPDFVANVASILSSFKETD